MDEFWLDYLRTPKQDMTLHSSWKELKDKKQLKLRCGSQEK